MKAALAFLMGVAWVTSAVAASDSDAAARAIAAAKPSDAEIRAIAQKDPSTWVSNILNAVEALGKRDFVPVSGGQFAAAPLRGCFFTGHRYDIFGKPGNDDFAYRIDLRYFDRAGWEAYGGELLMHVNTDGQFIRTPNGMTDSIGFTVKDNSPRNYWSAAISLHMLANRARAGQLKDCK